MPHAARSTGGLRRGPGPAVIGVVVLIAGIAVVFPALIVLIELARGITREGAGAALGAGALDWDGAALLLRTLRTAFLIAILSTALAWPVAWAARAKRGAWIALLVPMLLPGYLAYAGWGLLRAPGTPTGDLIAGALPPPWSSEPGYWPLLTGDILAVLGLALWAWPIAAVILAPAAAHIDASALEALRLEPGPRWRKRLCVLGMMRAPAIAAVLAVALVMFGSAVPLQLAQMRTYAVHLWLLLDQTPADKHWAVWASAWPLVLIAVAAALGISSRLLRPPDSGQAASSQPGRSPPASPMTTLIAGAVWSASVLAPAALFAWFIPGWRVMETFWRVHHQAFFNSLGMGGALALIAAAIAGSAWFGLTSGKKPRAVVGLCTVVFLIGGLVPGVLVGSATAAAWNASPATRWVGDSPAIVVLGHLARFGFVPMLIGAFLARSEPSDERDTRRLDGADGLRGWAGACLPGGLGTIAAAGIATGLLGFHEIEAAVILQPAGLDSFPRQMLAFLHYARTQELCAGALLTILVGLGGAALAIVCDALAGVRWR